MAETAADLWEWLIAEPIFMLVGGNVLLMLLVCLNNWRTRRLVRSIELRLSGLAQRLGDAHTTIHNVRRKTLELEESLPGVTPVDPDDDTRLRDE